MFLTVENASGSVAEWSKALVEGTSLFGGVGSNPTAAKLLLFWVMSSSTDFVACFFQV